MAPPKNTAQSTRIPPKPRALGFGEERGLKVRLFPPFTGPRVAANCWRGLGAPETVTVGADGSGLGFCDAVELVTENREETA